MNTDSKDPTRGCGKLPELGLLLLSDPAVLQTSLEGPTNAFGTCDQMESGQAKKRLPNFNYAANAK